MSYVKRDERTPYDKLTSKQQLLVKWLAEHPDSSITDAVAAGVCSFCTADRIKRAHLRAWVAAYRSKMPKTPQQLAEQATEHLNSLLMPAVRVLADTLIAGEGNATAVKTAQYILDGIRAQAAAAPAPKYRNGFEPVEEAELAAVLQLVGE